MRALFAADDFAAALEIAQRLIAEVEDETEDAEARQYALRCRESLERAWLARVGDLSAVPRVVLARRELLGMDLDSRAGSILSCIDGKSSFETVLDVSAMERLEALRILVNLLDRGVIA